MRSLTPGYALRIWSDCRLQIAAKVKDTLVKKTGSEVNIEIRLVSEVPHDRGKIRFVIKENA